MAKQPTRWVIVNSLENFRITRDRNFDIYAIKSRHRKKAEAMQAGDSVLFYVTKLQVIAGWATITGDYFEDHQPIWGCDAERKDDYPFRFPIKPELILPEEHFIPVETFRHKIEFLKKWPDAHWRLGFQGNIRTWPEKDFKTAITELEKAGKKVKKAS